MGTKMGTSDFEWQYPKIEVDWPYEDQILAYYFDGWQYDQSPRDDEFPCGRNKLRQGRLESKEDIMKWINQEVR